MSFLELKPHLKFTYRNSNSLATFDVSSEFIFVVTNSPTASLSDVFSNGLELCFENQESIKNKQQASPQIHQYTRFSAIPLITSISFTPVFSCYAKDRYFLASPDELFYFKYCLYPLYRISTLAYNFFYNDFLITVGESATIYRLEDFIVTSYKEHGVIPYKQHTITNTYKRMENPPSGILLSNGLCSAHLIFNNRIFLGFENGIVGEFSLESGELSVIMFLKDPVLSICRDESVFFVHTLSGVFKYGLLFESGLAVNLPIKETTDKSRLFTEIRGKKMVKHQNFLVLQQDKRLVVLNSDLKIVKTFVSLFEIREIKISDYLTVGCVNGLISEYSLDLFKSL